MNYVQLNADGFVIAKIVSREPIADMIEVESLPEDRDWFWAYHLESKTWVDTRTEAMLWAEVRDRRNALLAASDWTQLPDVPENIREAYKPYRQALRDITNFPLGTEFPTLGTEFPTLEATP